MLFPNCKLCKLAHASPGTHRVVDGLGLTAQAEQRADDPDSAAQQARGQVVVLPIRAGVLHHLIGLPCLWQLRGGRRGWPGEKDRRQTKAGTAPTALLSGA